MGDGEWENGRAALLRGLDAGHRVPTIAALHFEVAVMGNIA